MPGQVFCRRDFYGILNEYMETRAAGSLFGREHELARIHRMLERATTGPASLVLEGEPGIGKTSLWRVGIEAALERGRFVLRACPAEAERELSFSGLGDLLGSALGRLEALSPPRRHALEVALLLASDEYGAPDARAVGLGTLDLLGLLAEDGPLLVAIDDTQWLDPPSRETLAYALRRLDGPPVALLTASRPGAEPLPLGELERVVVGPLTLGALHEVIRARAPTAMTRPTLVRVHETSRGNPFFALELARALGGREFRPGEPLAVPATLSELTVSRFEPLDGEAWEVLLFVAALARPTVEVVTEAAGERASVALEAGAAAGLIEADGSRLRFTHPLLASAHYGAASPDDRRRVHRRLAQVVTDVEERGRHLGAVATGPDEEVAAALDRAAAAARSRGAPAAASELAEVAVRLTPERESASLLRRLCAAADHHFAAGSTARARALLEDALAGAPRGSARARVALQLGDLLASLDLVAVRRLLAQALMEAEGDPALRAEIHYRLASYPISDKAESRRQARLAFRLAERTGDPKLIAETLPVALNRDFWAGAGIDQGLISRGIALEEQLPLVALLRRPSSFYAFAFTWTGDLDRARPLYERLRALGRAEGGLDLMEILFYSAAHELMSENWEQAARYADEAWTLAVEAERDVEIALNLWSRAQVAAYRGQVDRARADAADAHRLATAVGLRDLLFSGRSLAVLELSLGDHSSALAHVRPATEEKLSLGLREPGLLHGFPEHVEAAIGCGELDEASELLGFVEEHARRLDRAWALGCCARGRALLAAARGDEAAAETAFALAYEQHARRPQQLPTYEHARTLLLHGSILRRRQQKRRAREALERALTIFERLGTAVYAKRARSELARIGGRAAAARDELSETERQIVELVVAGRRNREVADELSLSPNTVAWNLSKVYRKLGVSSRTELAARIAATTPE
jgi:DNA-binding CsgD family transcriptional regulator